MGMLLAAQRRQYFGRFTLGRGLGDCEAAALRSMNYNATGAPDELASAPTPLDKKSGAGVALEFNRVQDSLGRRYAFKLIVSLLSWPMNVCIQLMVSRALGPVRFGSYSYLSGFFTNILGFCDSGSSSGFYAKICSRPHENGLKAFYWLFAIIAAIATILLTLLLMSIGLRERLWPGQPVTWILLASFFAITTWFSSLGEKTVDAHAMTVKGEPARLSVRAVGLGALALLFFLKQLGVASLLACQSLLLVLQLLIWSRIITVPQEFVKIDVKKRFGCKVLTCYKAGCETKTIYTAEPSAHYDTETALPAHSGAFGAEACAGDRRESEGAYFQRLEPRRGDALRADQPRLEPERRVRRLEIAPHSAPGDSRGAAAGAQHAQPCEQGPGLRDGGAVVLVGAGPFAVEFFRLLPRAQKTDLAFSSRHQRGGLDDHPVDRDMSELGEASAAEGRGQVPSAHGPRQLPAALRHRRYRQATRQRPGQGAVRRAFRGRNRDF